MIIKMDNKKRSQWSSGFGFIMAAAGAAVGLGNIWGFPYKLGEGGGFLFLFFYLFFVVTVGYPVLVSELALGRHYGKGAVGSYGQIKPRYKLIGIMGIIACFIILGYYSYFGGIIMEYAAHYVKNLITDGLSGSALVIGGAGTGVSVFWMLIFMGITLYIVLQGIQGGIELCSKVMMPALIILLIYLAGKCLSLEGAADALKYMFKLDFSNFNGKTLSLALVQMFFSLSLGHGTMITYGSYLKKKESIELSAALIPLLDTLVAVLAAVVVIPTVFSFGMEPDAGPRLMFDALPLIFSEMSGGNMIGLIFFALLFFASVTSTISMLETVASSVTEELKVPRKKAAVIIAILEIIIALSVCWNPSNFQVYEYISQNVLVVLGALVTCIICGWSKSGLLVENEIEAGGARFRTKRFWRFLMRYITPLLIALVLLISMGVIEIN